MMQLLVKEMRQLKPIVFLWLGILALGYFFELATTHRQICRRLAAAVRLN